MKNNKLILELISNGCKRVKFGGKHEIWFSPITNKTFTCPNHGAREIPKGTEMSIRKLSGVRKNK